MAAFSGIPGWVQLSKQKVQKSEEWLSFTKALFDLVSVHMAETGVRSFGLLSPDEKRVLVLKGVASLKDHDAYKSLLASVSAALDQELSVAISAAGLDKQQKVSKSDVLSKECHNALESILSKWPDSKVHFIQCLNNKLSAELRYTIWKAQLENPVVKNKYVKLAETSPKRLVSSSDLEISQKCQTLIHSDARFRELREVRVASSVLRHLLSYHHVISTTSEPLTDTEYLIAVPFVYCTLAPILKARKSAKPNVLTTESMATMVEQFELFFSKRPDYTKSVEGSRSMKSFCGKLLEILTKVDFSLQSKLSDLYAKLHRTTEDAAENALADLFQPIVRSYFVGYLPLNTAMFVWDQIIIGYDVEHYDVIPYICVCLLLIQQNELMSCSTWRTVQVAFNNGIKTVTSDQICRMMNELDFAPKMMQLLEKEHSKLLHFPVSSAAVLNQLPPWRRWYSDKLATYLKSARKSSSDKFPVSSSNDDIKEKDNEEDDGRKESATELLLERDNLIHEVHQMREELEDARKSIRQEQENNLEFKEQAEEEIARLKRKVVFLEARKPLTPAMILPPTQFGLTEPQYEDSDTSSVVSAFAPPPSTSKTPPPSIPKTPVSESPPKSPPKSRQSVQRVEEIDAPPKSETPTKNDVTKSVMRDLTTRLMQGVNQVAHGSGADREALDNQTKADLASIRRAYDLAKLEVFGKPMSDDEIQKLPPDKGRVVSMKLSEATKRQLLKLKPTK